MFCLTNLRPLGLSRGCNDHKQACPSALRLDASAAWCQRWCSDQTLEYHEQSTIDGRDISSLISHKSPLEYSDTLSYSVLMQSLRVDAPSRKWLPRPSQSRTLYHFHGLFPFIKAIIHTILAGGTTHAAIFFAVAIAWIDLTVIFPTYH